ncbi:MAG: glycosyltransferase family 4 protein [Verrucomicrobia bacterium]|nr:glycosyltransferase family 4 protein [Verrucomicrobiota bacterium]
MKILVISDRFPPWSSRGAERIAGQLADEYARAGHEVVVVHGDPLELAPPDNRLGEWRAHWVDASGGPRWRGRRGIRNPRALRQLEQIVAHERPDVAHAHNLHEVFSFAALEVLARAGVPTVLTLHDCMSFHQGKFTEIAHQPDWQTNDAALRVTAWDLLRAFRVRFVPGRRRRIRAVLEQSGARIVAVSHLLRRALHANGVPCHGVIHNGVWHEAFRAEPEAVEALRRRVGLTGRRVMATFGRLTREKGSAQLLGALQLVCREVGEAVLFAVGTPAEQLAERTSLAIGSETLAGRELAAAYALADVVAVPSIYLDPFPTVALEAMAAGKPVVVSCYAGSSEVIESGQTGLVVDPFDVPAMAGHLRRLLTNKEEAERIGAAAQRMASERFTIKRCAGEYLALLAQVGESRGG